MTRLSVLFAILVLLLAAPAGARRPFVSDEAGLVASADESSLEEQLLWFITAYGTEFRVLVLRDLQGESLEQRARRTFDDWRVGEGRETGLLLVVLPDGRAHLQTPPDPEAPVSAERAARHVREVFAPAFAKGGLRPAVEALIKVVDTEELRPLFGPGFHRRPRGKPVDKFEVQYLSGSFALLLGVLCATALRVRSGRRLPFAPEDASAPRQEESFLLRGLRHVLGRPLRCPAWFDLLALTACALALRAAWLGVPEGGGGLIFDESYYVKHARIILGLPVEMPEGEWWLSGLDPNAEHPLLGKLLIALSMSLLGDNGWGWRLPSVLFGTASIPVLYGIAKRMGGGHAVALTAAYLLACDNLSFVHGRIATLDVFFVFFMLLAVYAYVSGWLELASAALALSTLCKISGLFGWAALIGFELARAIAAKWSGRAHVPPWKPLSWLSACYAACFLVFMGALDSQWGLYANPIEHVTWIFNYGKGLTNPGLDGTESEPWQWLLNQVEMPYMKIVRVEGDVERVVINFRGAMNPLVVWVAPLTVGYALVRGLRRYDQLALLAALLFFATYTPYWPMRHLSARVCYIHYFLGSVPAVALATAWFGQAVAPRWLRVLYLLGVTAAACVYFPFRELPTPMDGEPERRPLEEISSVAPASPAGEAAGMFAGPVP